MNAFLADRARVRRTIVLAASLAFMVVGTGSVYFIVVALKQISAEFHWPRTIPSIAYALQYIGAGVGGIFMGYVLDRVGMGLPAFIGAVMIGLGAVLTAFIDAAWQLFVIYGLMLGFLGRAALFAPLTANISRWFEHNKSMAVGIVGSGQALAGAVWPPIFQRMFEAVGWRETSLWYGAFALAAMLPLAMVLRMRPPPSDVAPGPAKSVGLPPGVRAPLSPRALQVILSTAAIGCCVAMSLPLAHLVSHVSDIGYDAARGAEILSLMLACAAASSFIGVGYLGGRFGGLKAIFVFSTTQAVFLATLAFVDDLTSLYVAGALFGMGYGGILPCYPVIVREYLPAAEAGRRTGLVVLCGGAGMAIGAWLGGAAFDLYGTYTPAFLTGVAFNLANLSIIAWLILRTKGVRERALA